MRYTLLITILWLGNMALMKAQETARGRVTARDEQPIPGANIINDHGHAVAVSDSSGYFSIPLPLHGKLFVSHVAYEVLEIRPPVDPDGILAIVLEPKATVMEEVEISTGFQHIPKERATGAFSHIDNKTFNEQISTDVLSRLEAVANGLDITRTANDGGGDMGIRIRGLSTLSSGAIRDPLIILDNFPYEGDLNNINPNDVENVTLLKDAAASSIWGARAGNGVIVITTKRGRRNQPMRLSFNSNLTVANKPDLHYFQQLDAQNFIELERHLFGLGHRFSDTASISRPTFSPVYEILFLERNGQISATEADNRIAQLGYVDVRDQYAQYIYEPAVNQQYALNLQGGSDRAVWYLSTGYDQTKSNLGAQGDRFNVNFRNTYNPIQSLQVQIGLMYTQSRNENGRTGFSRNTIPYTRIADENGNELPVTHQIRVPYLDTLGGGRLLDWHYYPLTDDQYIERHTALSHTLLNAGLNYTPISWLGVDLKYQYGRQQTRVDHLNRQGSYFTRNLINQFTQIPTNRAGVLSYPVPLGDILDLSRSYLETHNLRGQLNLNPAWDIHEVSALLGIEGSLRNIQSNGNRTYGYNPDILVFSHVDYINQYRHSFMGHNLFVPNNQYFTDRTARFISTFANAAYTLDKKYSVSLSARSDASNQFGVNFNDRWNLLWSSGFSWDISRERFYKGYLIPYLRFRATYGFSGNTDLSQSANTVITTNSSPSPYMNVPMSYISQNPNPELGWERIRTLNMAVDFRSINNRLSGSLDLFYKYATNLFGPDPVDPTTGISGSVIRNVAALKGRGLDLELNSLNINQRLRWYTNLNLSYYTDKVVSYYWATLNPSSYVTQPGSPTRIEGERLFSLYSFRWGGLDPETGDPVGFIGGEPSKDYNAIRGAGAQMEDVINHGSAIPVIYGSIGNTFSYGNFGLDIRVQYRLGYYFRDEAVHYNGLLQGRGGGQHGEYLRRWVNPGDEAFTSIPSLRYPSISNRDQFYELSEIKAERGDHFRLKYINLHYNLHKAQLKYLPIRDMQIYLNAANLGIVWKATSSKIDPDLGIGVLPPSATYSLGIRIGL